MSHPGAAAAAPTMREVRDHVLSVLLSTGSGQDPSAAPQSLGAPPQTPAQPAYQYPTVPRPQATTPSPAPAPPHTLYPHAHTPAPPHNFSTATPSPVGVPPAWAGHPPSISSASWASPLRPVEADVRVAELTAGLVAATDVERRQADTIRRLAAQLEKSERLERQRSARKQPRAADSRVHDREHRLRPSRRSNPAQDEPQSPSPGSVIDDDTASDLTGAEFGDNIGRDDSPREEPPHRSSRSSGKRRPPSRQVRISPETPRVRSVGTSRSASAKQSPPTRSAATPKVSQSASKSRVRRPEHVSRAAESGVDDGSFAELRRKVATLQMAQHENERHAVTEMELRDRSSSLAKENAALLAEREEARKEAGNMSSALAEIRQTATALVALLQPDEIFQTPKAPSQQAPSQHPCVPLAADREQLLATINQLRQAAAANREDERLGAAKAGDEPRFAPAVGQEQSQSSPPELRRQGHVEPAMGSCRRCSGDDLSPASVRFPGFDTPTPCRAGPFGGDEEGRLEGEVEPIRNFDENEDREPSMEHELRAELRLVLQENAALSERVIEVESANKADADSAEPELEELQTEVMVLASVVDSMNFNIISHDGDRMNHRGETISRAEDVARTQATMMSAVDGDATAALLGGRRIALGSGSDTVGRTRSIMATPGDSVEEIAGQVASIRHSIALKYGQWLSQAGGDRHNSEQLLTTLGLDVTGFAGDMRLPRASFSDSGDDTGVDTKSL